MKGEEEVELTIQTEVSGMKGSTRAPMEITEEISTIVAIAFDGSGALIKKVDATLTPTNDYQGTLKIKVPKRTQTIHFLGNYTKNDIEESITSLETLNNFTTTDATTMPTMRYWGKAEYNGGNNLSVTLYRNMAKLTLKKGDGFTANSCYIAGFVNRNLSGTIVPSGYAVGDTPTIPNGVTTHTYTADNSLGNVYYLFEHANVENSNPLYVIIEVAAKYYKVAFAAGDEYFPIIRNHEYTITIDGIDAMYAENDYTDAVNSQYPINDLVITNVPMTVTPPNPAEVQNESGLTFTVTVTIPEGITELNVPTHDAFDITPPNSLTPQNGKYAITEGNYEFTFTVKPDVEAGDKTISFSGRGKYKSATGSANIGLYDNVQLTVAADPATIYNTAESTRNVTVSVPQGITTLTIPDATTAEFIVSSTDVTLNNNSCDVSSKQGQSITFTLALRTDGNVGDKKTVTFNGSGQYKRATGSTTLTLEQAPAQEILPVYELWFENNNTWNGSQDYATFFTRMGDLTTNNGNQGNMNATFYDPSFTVNEVAYSGADAKKTNAMVMGENNSISFTIPDTRYLTLLVARKDNAPSIDLQKNGEDWTISSNEAKVPANYNFANGDITNKGRLIRYELPAGTYTLQRGNNDYLLYYMRVSKDRPTMTDTELVQVQANSYVLSWSDNTKDRFHKENDTKYFVDEEATTFTAKLNYQEWQNVNLTTTNLGISTVTWNFDNSKEESQGTRNNPEEHSYDGNETVSIEYHNAGTYTLSGTVAPNASYKYAAFYDRLPLSPVNFEVKNTIKVGLYDSWDGNAAPVSTYTDGKPLILGFKWPSSTLPIEPGQQIQFTIPDVWVRDASGSGITYDEPNNGTRTYRIGNENNRYHPRTDWTYKIEWRDVAADNISATTTTNDIYFSYNGTIGKSVTIATPITNDNLDVALDFYADFDNNSQIDDSENRSDNRYEDLQLGTTHFYLKATISYDDSEKYDNQTVVQLQGAYPAYNGAPNNGSVIDWAGSRVSGDGNNNITYTNNNGNGLKFTVHRGVTEYFIEWVFKPTQQYQNGDIAFTYTLSNNQGYNVSGESPVIAFTNESNYSNNNVLNLPLNIALDFYRKYSNGNTDDSYNNLIYGVSRVGLKATITIPNGQDPADYYDKIVYLQGAFSIINGTGNAGIHWDNSRDSGNDFEIAYKTDVNHDGTQLQFKIENGKTEYDIEWVFKGGSQYNSSNNSGNVRFTYTISAQNGSHQISGQNSATLDIKRSADIHNQEFKFSTGNKWDTNKTFNEIFPIGTDIFISYSEGQLIQNGQGSCSIKFTESKGENQLYIPKFESDPGYGPKQNLYMSFTGAKDFQFTVDTTVAIYEYVANNNDPEKFVRNLSEENPLNGLQLQGTDAVLQRVTVTAPPSAFPNNNPNYVP